MSDLGSTVPVREGLPSNYRMRADAHYVDQLVAPVGRRAAEDDVRALPSPPAKVAAPAANAPRAEIALLNEDELARSLTAVLSCTELLDDGMPRLTRRVAVDMIRAEAQRAICALRAAHVLKQGLPQERRLIDARTIIERVADTVAPETRLRGSRVSVAIDVSDDVRVRADESSLVSALSAVVVMISSGLHDLQGARLDLKVSSSAAGRITFSMAQESVILPDIWLRIAQGGLDAGVSPDTAPLLVLRQVADALGGTLAVTRLPHGTQISLDLPAEGTSA